MKVAAGIVALTALTFALFCGRAHAQESVEAQAAQLAQTLVKQHEAWRSKMSTPGASIQAKESGREDGNVQYRLYVSGLPEGRLYTVINWPVTQRTLSTAFEGVSLGKDGLVSCTGRLAGECIDPDTSPEDHGAVDFVFFHPEKGEPFRIAIGDGDSRAAIVIVPDPIAAKDKGCTLEVVRLTPGFEVAYFTGSGYPPNSQVAFDTESYKEKHAFKTTADGGGEIHFAVLPFVTGHAGGTTKIVTTGLACAPSLKFEWGKP
jgi:hypothetical protein